MHTSNNPNPQEIVIFSRKVMNFRIPELGDVFDIPLQKHQDWFKEKAFGKIWPQRPHGLAGQNIHVSISRMDCDI